MNISQVHHALNGHAGMCADDPKLKSAAHEFEASLMQEFLKPLQRDPLFSSGESDGIGQDDQGSSGALMSFGSEALAKGISEHGGFGIASDILHHFRTAETGHIPASGSKILEYSKNRDGTRD